MRLASHTLNTDEASDQVYNAFDTCVTHEIFTALQEQIPAAQPAYNFELALQGPVLEMMLRGFRVDPIARQAGLDSLDKLIERLEQNLDTLAKAVWDKPLNSNSGTQLKALFYDHIGIRPILSWVKGEQKAQMDRATLERLEEYFELRPIVRCILALRDAEKQKQVLSSKVDSDCRMRSSYNIGGTNTGRFSSSKSPTDTGGNQQNITKDLRHILIADKDQILCGIDAEQSDSRMVGYMCGLLFDNWTYLDAAESSDLHTTVARMVWPKLPWTGEAKADRKIAEQNFYRHLEYREACKRLGHGANFLGKAATLAKGAHVPTRIVEEFIENYFGSFPAIRQWQAWVAAELQTKNILTSIHGRKRDFFDRTSADETVRKGCAWLAAAATADNLNLGMWRVWRHMPEVQLLAQVHDAIYFQFPKTLDAAAVVARAQDLLTTRLTAPNGRVFAVPTDAKLGYNWGNYDEKHNPKGLRKVQAFLNA